MDSKKKDRERRTHKTIKYISTHPITLLDRKNLSIFNYRFETDFSAELFINIYQIIHESDRKA